MTIDSLFSDDDIKKQESDEDKEGITIVGEEIAQEEPTPQVEIASPLPSADKTLPFIPASLEAVRITPQEIIRMRNAARKAHGLIKDMSVEDRTRRIIEISACITKMRAFEQEMRVIEGELLDDADEETKQIRQKLDRKYKSERGRSDDEKKVISKKLKGGVTDLARQANLNLEDIFSALKNIKKAE